MKNFGRRKVRNQFGRPQDSSGAINWSNYLLFSVDENQKIAVPTVNADSETALVSQPNL
jgi:hypothetical protein